MLNCPSLFRLVAAFSTALAALLLTTPLSAQTGAGAIPNRLQIVISGHKLPADSYGFHVQETGNGRTVLDINSATPMNPASTMKVLTTLTALEQLGPNYSWITQVHALGTITDGTLNGDLLIKGSGDPYLLEDQLRNMLKAVQRAGVRRITGDLVLDTSYFDPAVSEGPLIDNQEDRAYNVLPNALMSNFQAVTFYFRPHEDGKHVVIDADPDLSNLSITNNLRLGTGRCEGYQRGITFNVSDVQPEHVQFDGTFPASCGEYLLVRSVMTPENFFYGLFTLLWQQLGGEFHGNLKMAIAPEAATPLVSWFSPPLSEVIRSINKFSNNLMTRQTLLTLGAEQFEGPATVANGGEVIGKYLAMLGIDSTGLVISNGAGLARETRISPLLMSKILQHGHDSPYMPEFVASLPINGVDGTMRNRLRSGSMRGTMHIKTGTLDEVSAVAGYVTAQSGKHYTVVGMLNHAEADRGPGIELMDALLAWVYEQ